ncbi:uncharacterized protein SRS1_11911 [Sporisorium reilianum f. sp. reilianum]|uniref:Rnh202 triple barrel domain-containing protein n=1 Tax=Sporisorium reilianum f. sp. reilianum TaxID=72559 RepID=A0A2N8U8Q7_9BASI|nr:uncharacterized protein SRS1_11911 [Sporisorium reilianum f. sp. reilianum]
MAAAALPSTHDVSAAATRSIRTGVLLHPTTAHSGRFLVLPHPRTLVPTYYLHCPATGSAAQGELYELSTLSDIKYERSWMLSRLNCVVGAGQLDIVSRVDVRFVVVALLCALGGDGKFRSVEDTFEQVALVLQARRSEALCAAVPEVTAAQHEWTDIVAFGNLPLVKRALQDVADVQDLPNGDTAYRLSRPKLFRLLDTKHAALAQRATFAAAPNTLGRSFERTWPLDSDPSIYLSSAGDDEEAKDCTEAQQLRSKIAAEVVATLLPPQLAVEYFAHLHIAV